MILTSVKRFLGILINLAPSLQKCGCAKSKCITNACTCFKRKKECTKLCTCLNCNNDLPHSSKNVQEVEHDSNEDDSEEEETDSFDEQEDNEGETDAEDVCVQFFDDIDLGDDFITLHDEFDDLEFDEYDYTC